MRRFTHCMAMVAVSLLAFTSIAPLLAQTGGALKFIKVDGKNNGPTSSAAVLAGQTLYIAGQNGLDAALPADISQQVAQSLHNVQAVLRAANMDFANLVWMHIYVTSAQDLAAMNDVYWKTIGAYPPARTVLVVGGLPNGEKVVAFVCARSNAAAKNSKHVMITPVLMTRIVAGIGPACKYVAKRKRESLICDHDQARRNHYPDRQRQGGRHRAHHPTSFSTRREH